METPAQLVWADIPVLDLERAKFFYEAVFNGQMELMETPDGEKAHLMKVGENFVWCIMQATEALQPSVHGARPYFSTDDIGATLARVEAAGGKIKQEKVPVGPFGFIAFFMDTEGNELGLHSDN